MNIQRDNAMRPARVWWCLRKLQTPQISNRRLSLWQSSLMFLLSLLRNGPACGLCGNENDAKYTYLRRWLDGICYFQRVLDMWTAFLQSFWQRSGGSNVVIECRYLMESALFSAMSMSLKSRECKQFYSSWHNLRPGNIFFCSYGCQLMWNV